MPTENELTYLYSLTRLGIRPGLQVMERMLQLLGNPEAQFKSIHVTGTNGKGSTCAMIESVLRAQGYTTALYTSPHLYAFNERIRVAGKSIPDTNLRALIAEIRICIEKENMQPTFFEFTTALAFCYFARSNIDVAVIEVGMGGRYDATNGIIPLVSVITNVGLDHTEYLGPTTAHIAFEKAGIIKAGIPVVTAEKDPDILEIFDTEAKEKHTNVIRVDDIVQAKILSSDLAGQEVEVQIANSYLTPASPSKGEESASDSPPYEGGVRGGSSRFKIHLPLLGVHQIENLKTAIAALVVLEKQGVSSRDAIITGIKQTTWEGRLHIISRDPLVIVDGAHNPDGTRALAVFLQQISRYDVLVFAAKKGKDISDMLNLVIPLFSCVIITEGSFMPEKAEHLAKKISAVHANVIVKRNVDDALQHAGVLASVDGTIVITGSLYMIADALIYYKGV